MADPTFVTAVVAFVVGIGAGAFWAWLGWLKSNEPFEAKKFTLGIVTGAISSLVIVLASISGITTAADATAQFLALVALFLAVGGVDTLRTGVSGAVANRATNEPKEQQ